MLVTCVSMVSRTHCFSNSVLWCLFILALWSSNSWLLNPESLYQAWSHTIWLFLVGTAIDVPRDWTQNLDSMEPQWWFISRGHHQIRGFLYLWVRFWILCCMNILRKWDNEMNRYVSTIVLVSSSGLCSPQGVAWAFRVSSGRQQGFQSTALWMVGHKRDDAIGFKRNQETLMV